MKSHPDLVLHDEVELGLEPDQDPEDEVRVTRITKSPLHLLLMLSASDCPPYPDDQLFVNVGGRHPLGTMTLRADASIDTEQGVKHSLSTAAKVYMPWRRSFPDGWELVKYPHPGKLGRYLSMNTLFQDCWRQLGAPLEVLEQDDLLYAELCRRGYRVQADLYHQPVPRVPDGDQPGKNKTARKRATTKVKPGRTTARRRNP